MAKHGLFHCVMVSSRVIIVSVTLLYSLWLQKQGKTSSSVYDSPRAMAKLLKEAKRVKRVLSANTDHVAQVTCVCWN